MGQLAFALSLLESLPGLISAGQNVVALVTGTTAALKRMQAENRDPSDADWDDLNKAIADLRMKLHS